MAITTEELRRANFLLMGGSKNVQARFLFLGKDRKVWRRIVEVRTIGGLFFARLPGSGLDSWIETDEIREKK